MDKTTYSTYKAICSELQKSEEIDVVEVIEVLAASLIHVLGGGRERRRSKFAFLR